MNLAIMQPYFFPYIGYWHLLNSVDACVLYDDVHYMKGGWINRNRILVNGQPSYITVPLRAASPNRLICDIEIDNRDDWRRKLQKNFQLTYARASHFDEVYPLLCEIVAFDSPALGDYLLNQLQVTCRALGIRAALSRSSALDGDRELKGEARVLDICKRQGADVYVNLPGGRSLYSSQRFSEHGLTLKFIESSIKAYQQRGVDEFVPYLSIIDVLMNSGIERTRAMLTSFALKD